MKRARREAEKADRRASRHDPTKLAGHKRVLPLPSQDETRLLSPDELAEIEVARMQAGAPTGSTPAEGAETGSGADGVVAPEPERTSILNADAPVHHRDGGPHSAESRLYSGSPEAEERARLMEGPAPEDMAEREELARRRRGGVRKGEGPDGENPDGEGPQDEKGETR